MESCFLNMDEAARYTGIKKSNLYVKVERKEIPHYRVGRLIFFKKEEIGAWMEGNRVESIDPKKEAKAIMKKIESPSVDFDRLIKNAIDGIKEKPYTSGHGKSDRIKGLRKEVSNGAL